MADLEAKRDSQVEHQCKRLAEITTEIHSSFSTLEKRMEPALAPCAPAPETAKEDKKEESLCLTASTLRVIADDLSCHLASIRTLTDRIEI